MTMAEKVLARSGGVDEVAPGDIVTCEVDIAMSHEATAQMLEPMEKMGASRVWDPTRVVVLVDHWVPASNEATATMHKQVREFVRRWGVTNFYDVGRHGICHQILAEKGWVLPGDLCIGSDSHTTMLGGLGAFGTGVGPTEMAAVYSTGKIWLKVPNNLLIHCRGKLQEYVYGKDVILHAIGRLTVTGAIYKAVEYSGPGIAAMTVPDRLSISNMTVEMGGKAGLCPPDEKTREYLEKIHQRPFRPFATSDREATFQERLDLDLDTLGPQVACPPNVDNVKDISAVAGTKVDQIFVGSCTNGRIEDLRMALDVMDGRPVHPDARMIVSPASTDIYRQALEEGLVERFVDAGALVTQSSCGPCFGGHMGILAEGEVCLSTSNRNFIGRMGSRKSSVYLASPAVAGATAVVGSIADPRIT